MYSNSDKQLFIFFRPGRKIAIYVYEGPLGKPATGDSLEIYDHSATDPIGIAIDSYWAPSQLNLDYLTALEISEGGQTTYWWDEYYRIWGQMPWAFVKQ